MTSSPAAMLRTQYRPRPWIPDLYKKKEIYLLFFYIKSMKERRQEMQE